MICCDFPPLISHVVPFSAVWIMLIIQPAQSSALKFVTINFQLNHVDDVSYFIYSITSEC